MPEPITLQSATKLGTATVEEPEAKNGKSRRARVPIEAPPLPPEEPPAEGGGDDGEDAPPEEPVVTVSVWYYLCPQTGAFFYAGHRPSEPEFRLYEPGPSGTPSAGAVFRMVSLNCQVKRSEVRALQSLDPLGVMQYFNERWDDFFPDCLNPYQLQVVRG